MPHLLKYKVLPQIQTAKLTRALAAFDDPEWLFELKHDGFRALAYLEDGRCRLVSRHRNTYKSFETVSHEFAKLRAKNAIINVCELLVSGLLRL